MVAPVRIDVHDLLAAFGVVLEDTYLAVDNDEESARCFAGEEEHLCRLRSAFLLLVSQSTRVRSCLNLQTVSCAARLRSFPLRLRRSFIPTTQVIAHSIDAA